MFARCSAGPHPGSEHFRNILWRKVGTWPALLFARMIENLIFANASFLQSVIAFALADGREVGRALLVVSNMSTIGSMGLEMPGHFVLAAGDASVTAHLSGVEGPVMDRLKQAGFENRRGTGKVFASAHQAARQSAA